MIVCKLAHLEARCRQRGYTLDRVRPCIVSQDGDTITVDETHPAYPRAQPGQVPIVAAPAPAHGPGAELKRMLSRVGIHATATCACNARAAHMDRWGPDKCEKRLDQIVGWLQEEHAKRAAARETILPFSKLLAANIVKLAIRRARRNEP
jgi:hypothetical protein